MRIEIDNSILETVYKEVYSRKEVKELDPVQRFLIYEIVTDSIGLYLDGVTKKIMTSLGTDKTQ